MALRCVGGGKIVPLGDKAIEHLMDHRAALACIGQVAQCGERPEREDMARIEVIGRAEQRLDLSDRKLSRTLGQGRPGRGTRRRARLAGRKIQPSRLLDPGLATLPQRLGGVAEEGLQPLQQSGRQSRAGAATLGEGQHHFGIAHGAAVID